MAKELFHVLKSSQFDRELLDELYNVTNKIRKLSRTKEGAIFLKKLLAHKRAMLYFTQPSTRTFLSFLNACQILGMETSEIRDPNTSSEVKGEAPEDALRTFSSYVDLIIMRSPKAGFADRIATLLDETPRRVPILNGGSGKDEHPTQALLDIYTLRRSFEKKGDLSNKKIAMVGDVLRGRTVRSLSRMMKHFENIELFFVSPEKLRIADDLKKDLADNNVKFTETTNFEEVIPEADAIYMTRIQDEYDVGAESKGIDYSGFHFKEEHLKILKNDAVIMHPLPRRAEIEMSVDKDPRAKYWRQERNGMWTRVALIAKVFGVHKDITNPYST